MTARHTTNNMTTTPTKAHKVVEQGHGGSNFRPARITPSTASASDSAESVFHPAGRSEEARTNTSTTTPRHRAHNPQQLGYVASAFTPLSPPISSGPSSQDTRIAGSPPSSSAPVGGNNSANGVIQRSHHTTIDIVDTSAVANGLSMSNGARLALGGRSTYRPNTLAGGSNETAPFDKMISATATPLHCGALPSTTHAAKASALGAIRLPPASNTLANIHTNMFSMGSSTGSKGGSGGTVVPESGASLKLSETDLQDPLKVLAAQCYGACMVRFDELTFIKHIGVGEFSDVYEARWRGKPVAVKRIKTPKEGWTVASKAETLGFLSREVLQWHDVEHRRIISLVGVSLLDGWEKLCLVMELATGGSLYHLLHQQRIPLSLSVKLTMCEQLADALACLHSKGVIHGDLKSLNCLLDNRLNLMLCDFGLSRRFEAGKKLYRPPTGIGGSVRWMAPELMDGRCNEFDESVDMWSLGCLFHEIMTLTIPFAELSDENQLKQAIVLQGAVPTIPPSVQVHSGVISIIHDCFSANPAQRPTALETLAQIQHLKMQICA
eukprot:Filipodium_phascolosomae@DN1607_c0_g1_i1.p1